jgi:putative tryptophan/tyrosine transport system substrate-binding protein
MGIQRRHFLAALGGAAAAWPYAARAQKPPARIGILANGAAASLNSAYQIRTIKRGLDDNGLVESRDYVFEPRFAAGHYERFPQLALELAQAGVAVILANTIPAVSAAQHLIPPLPVVMISIHDPMGASLIASLARPGGHTTGTAVSGEDLTQKMLAFQRAILPHSRSMAALYNPANPTNPVFPENLRKRAVVLKMSMRAVGYQSRDELEAAFDTFATKRPDALWVMSDSGTTDLSDRVAALAIAHRLPTFSNIPEFARQDGLLAYGVSREPLYFRSGYFVKKILEGADAGELPVEQPSRVELWINQKTAAKLDLTIPASLLAAADKVIE